MSDSLPSRRELVQVTLRAAALPGAAHFFAQWLAAAKPSAHNHELHNAPPEPPFLRDYTPRFFSSEDFGALQAFTEILIPSDDAPGAKEAYCAHFIDFVLQASSETPDTQRTWIQALYRLKKLGFHVGGQKERETIMMAISLPERDKNAKHEAYDVYRMIKQQTAFAFYTSRIGMIDVLDYRGNSYNASFPGCEHPEHHEV